MKLDNTSCQTQCRKANETIAKTSKRKSAAQIFLTLLRAAPELPFSFLKIVSRSSQNDKYSIKETALLLSGTINEL